MDTPQTLARPLAARIANLPDPVDVPQNHPIPETVKERAAEAMTAGHTHYTDRPGILPLRARAVEMLGKKYGIELSADEVTITCGATEARFVALKQLAKPGTRILCAGDGAAIAGAAALIGLELTNDPEQIDLSMVYLTPADSPEQRDRLLETAAEESLWIIWDIAASHSDAAFHPAQHPAIAHRVITIDSASQQLPGWRVGWMAGSEAANKLRAYKQSLTICTTSVAQWAALGLEEG
jgi:aspartate/methionine/tyrosine aminotransferase